MKLADLDRQEKLDLLEYQEKMEHPVYTQKLFNKCLNANVIHVNHFFFLQEKKETQDRKV